MADHSNMKLGKAHPRLDARTLRFAKYLPPALPTQPTAVDWLQGKTDFGMLGNDQLGDCTIAACFHTEQVISMNVDQELGFTTPEAIEYYSKWCGYVPGRPDTDNGGVELDVLNSWRRDKLLGHQLLAYAALDPGNVAHVQLSVALLGNCYIGLALPISAQAQDDWDLIGSISDPDNQPDSWGGHAVNVVSYDSEWITIITWGMVKRMSWRFWAAYTDEAYGLALGYWFRDGVAPSGKLFGDVSGDELFRINDMLADVAQLAG